MSIFNVKVTENDTFKVIPKALNSFDIKTVQRIYTYGASNFSPIVTLGAESLLNENFDSNSNGWSLAGGWSWNSSAIDTSGSSGSLTQDVGQHVIPIVVGNTYRTSYTITNYSSGSVRLKIGNIQGVTRSSNGTYTEDISVSSGTSFGIFNVSGTQVMTLDSMSCKLIGLADQTVSIDAQKDVDISSVFSDPDIGNRELGIIDKLIITASSGNKDQCGVSVFENSSEFFS